MTVKKALLVIRIVLIAVLPVSFAVIAASSIAAHEAAKSASGAGGGNIAAIARAEYESGKKAGDYHAGGSKYWSDAGFGGRVEWCGCFTGWCAKQAGLTPGTSMPSNYPWAASWAAFYDQNPDKGKVHANDGKYMPSAGDIAVNGAIDASWSQHVGIVEKVEDGYIYTIEGNYSDSVQCCVYYPGNTWTYFSTPIYPAGGAGELMEGVDWSMSEKEFVEEWGKRVDAFYATYYPSAPLGGHGEDFARSAYRNHVDPRLVAAISITESGGGTHCWTSYNAWGWAAADGAYDYARGTFSSWAQGIETVTAGLARGYSDLHSIEEISKRYCPPNAALWAERVSDFMSKM